MGSEPPSDWEELSSEQQSALLELADARIDGSMSRRQALKAGGVGALGLLGLSGSASAAPASTSDNDGDIGTPSSRVDLFADGVDADSVSTDNLNNVEYVATESELKNAVGSHTHIALADDITWSDSRMDQNIESADFHLFGRGKKITRANGQDDGLIKVTTTGEVSVSDLYIDGNEPNNDDTGVIGKEIMIQNAAECRLSDIVVDDNLGMALNPYRCDTVVVSDCEVDSAGGVHDGVHIRDPVTAVVNGGYYDTSDDAVVINAEQRDGDSWVVSGVSTAVTKGTANGSGIRAYADTNARTVDNIHFQGEVHGSTGHGVLLNEINGGSLTVGQLTVDVTVENAGSDGDAEEALLSSVTVESANISGTFRDSSIRCIFMSDLTLNATVKDTDDEGVVLRICDDVSGQVQISNTGGVGMAIEDTEHTYLTGNIHDCGGGAADAVDTTGRNGTSDNTHGEIHTYNTSGVSLAGGNSTLTTV